MGAFTGTLKQLLKEAIKEPIQELLKEPGKEPLWGVLDLKGPFFGVFVDKYLSPRSSIAPYTPQLPACSPLSSNI